MFGNRHWSWNPDAKGHIIWRLQERQAHLAQHLILHPRPQRQAHQFSVRSQRGANTVANTLILHPHGSSTTSSSSQSKKSKRSKHSHKHDSHSHGHDRRNKTKNKKKKIKLSLRRKKKSKKYSHRESESSSPESESKENSSQRQNHRVPPSCSAWTWYQLNSDF